MTIPNQEGLAPELAKVSSENLLKNRTSAVIDEIEASFRSGTLGEAARVAPQIERVGALTADEFAKYYRAPSQPVVIQGLLEDWPALKKWSFAYLQQQCGSARVVIDSYNSQRARQATFREFCEALEPNRRAGGAPLYLQEWLFMSDCPFLAQDMPELAIAQYDFRRNLYGERISTNHQLWIGQTGATTRIHQDSYLIDVLHAQIIGEKLWYLAAPPACLTRDRSGQVNFDEFLANPATQLFQCVLKPADVLYLPALWWHRIELLSDSVGLGRKCLDERNLKEHIRCRFAELLCLALNPAEIKELYPELYNVVLLRNHSWARMMDIDLSKLRP